MLEAGKPKEMTDADTSNLFLRGDVYHVRVMVKGRVVWRSTGCTTPPEHASAWIWGLFKRRTP